MSESTIEPRPPFLDDPRVVRYQAEQTFEARAGFLSYFAERTSEHNRPYVLETLLKLDFTPSELGEGFRLDGPELAALEASAVRRQTSRPAVAGLEELTYEEYLLSSTWQSIRSAALSHGNHRCALCGSPKRLEVHHSSYPPRGHETFADLIVLCNQCHARHHDALPKP